MRSVFGKEWGCPCLSIWPWSSVSCVQGLHPNCGYRYTNAPSGTKRSKRTQRPLQCPKNTIKGNRLQYCRDSSLHIHHCMLGLTEELNFLTHGFSYSSYSFSPPAGTWSLHHLYTKLEAKSRGSMSMLKNQPGLRFEGTGAENTHKPSGASSRSAAKQQVVIWLMQL